MTWIVGANSLFGMCFLVSDIQITFSFPNGEKKYVDCCQKIYPIGQFVGAGFAGSVRIGFSMIETLRRELFLQDKRNAWDLDLIANDWLPEVLKDVFDNAEPFEKNQMSQIIMAGASPTKNRGEASMPWTEVYIFLSPNFYPVKAQQTEAISIGSGNMVTLYRDKLRDTVSYENETFHQMAVGDMKKQGRYIAHNLDNMVREQPVAGISPLFQVMSITRGEIHMCNHEYEKFGSGGSTTKIKFPPQLACSYSSFLKFCENQNIAAEGACA